MKTYGLIGKNIDYSFSRIYFSEKFSREELKARYLNFDLEDIEEFPEVIRTTRGLSGLNVTIPYKQRIIPFLDRLDADAKKIGAVNTIKLEKDGSLSGYNTDFIGFSRSLQPLLNPGHSKGLILGTGGASKAVAFALTRLGITYTFVSRTPQPEQLSYEQLSKETLQEHTLLVNCTPLGTFPDSDRYPPVSTEHLGPSHLVYDLIYNPPLTRFLDLARKQGATIINGKRMLELQAEAAWNIWNS